MSGHVCPASDTSLDGQGSKRLNVYKYTVLGTAVHPTKKKNKSCCKFPKKERLKNVRPGFAFLLRSSAPLGLFFICHHDVPAPPSEPNLLRDRRDRGQPGQPLEQD